MISYADRIKQRAPVPAEVAAPGAPVLAVLRRHLAALLQLDEQALEDDVPFVELGLNSLLAVRLIDGVNRALGLRLGIEVLFDRPSLSALAEHILHTAPDACAALGAGRGRDAPVGGASTTRGAEQGPIAIIGMSGRFAGAPDLAALWTNLAAGTDSITEVPPERWRAAEFYDAAPQRPGKTVSKWAGFIADIDRFDPEFFGISPREAAAIDPQQRLFLEHAFLALEDAGCSRERLSRRAVGVYAGASSSGYERFIAAADAYAMLGNNAALLAARIAYFLDLTGPAITIDTACSSSLVAVDLACQALRQGRVSLALAGGVSLFLDEQPFLLMSQAGMLSADGRCKAFDEAADGIVVGEGVGVVVLKPLAQARADRDRIIAVIRGTGTNQDGRTNGITAPSARSQAELLRSVWREAGVPPRTIAMIEAHGTGTSLGDPIEVAGLCAALEDHPGPCALGSVKTNIGHTSAAAGIAALIKASLCLTRRQLVPSLHFVTPNRRSGLVGSPLRVTTELCDWPPSAGTPRRAGVSSFGLSGTNAHALLEEAPTEPRGAASTRQPWRLIAVSARTASALRRRCAALAAWLARAAHPDLADLAHTLGWGRTHFECRLAWVVEETGSLVAALERAGQGAAAERTEPAGPGGGPGPGDAAPTTDDPETWRRWLTELAAVYVRGGTPPWAALSGPEPRLLELPPYPFERQVCWPRARPAAALHPLLGERRGDGFVVRLTPQQAVVGDHVLGGRAILHAALGLEMARAGAEALGHGPGLELRDVAWLRTIAVPAEGATAVLGWTAGAGGLEFTLALAGEPAPAVRCVVVRPAAVEACEPLGDLRALAAEHQRHLAGPALVGDASGAARLGPTFRGLRDLWLHPEWALARVEIDRADPGLAVCGLHPTLMDAAVQTAMALVAQADGVTMRLRVPVALTALTVDGPPLAGPGFVLARRSRGEAGPDQARVDVWIADEAGRVRVRWRGFTVQAVARAQPRVAPAPDPGERPAGGVTPGFYRPVWRAAGARPAGGRAGERGRTAAPAVILGPRDDHGLAERLSLALGGARRVVLGVAGDGDGSIDAADPGALGRLAASLGPGARVFFLAGVPAGRDLELERLERDQVHTMALLHLVQALAGTHAGVGLELCVLTHNVYRTGPDDTEINPLGSGALGLAKAVRCEFPGWRVRAFDLDAGAQTIDAALLCGVDDVDGPDGEAVAVRGGRRLVRALEPGPGPTSAGEPRRGGVFMIVGGAGRLGRELARELAARRQGRLVLVGRSPAGPAVEAQVRELRALGGDALYCVADVSDRTAMQAAVDRAVAVFGGLHGVVQAAVEPTFGRLASVPARAFEAALRAKVHGAWVLERVTRGLDLEFLATCSSIAAFAGFPGNRGQASYCSACCFEEAFAGFARFTRGRPAWIVHWGVWASDDFRPDAVDLVRSYGMEPLPPTRGVEAFTRAVGGDAWQVLYAGLRPSVWTAMGARSEDEARVDAVVRGLAARRSATLAGAGELRAQIDALGHARVLQALRRRGLLRQVGERRDREALRQTLAVRPKHDALFAAIVDMLARAGVVRREGEVVITATAVTDDALRDQIAGLDQALAAADAAGAARLLERCTGALPDVLCGDVPATDVLFPGGSMALVEGVYKRHPTLLHFSGSVAEAVRRLALERPTDDATGGEPLRVLEVGAGTGATTEFVLRALAGSGVAAQYHYTDLSPAFVSYGRRQFAAPHLRFATLDISVDPATQGFELGQFDVVLATNVLHATREVAAVLRHVHALLRPGGVALISELTRVEDFGTLTFGLLDGWWSFDDPAVRLPGSPLLSAPGWCAALAAAGFVAPQAVGAPGEVDPAGFSNSLIIAVRPRSSAAAAPASSPAAAPAQVRRPRAAEVATDGASQLATRVARIVAEAIELPADRLDVRRPFAELGVDSIVSPQIIAEINRALAIELRSTDLFNFATVRALCEHIAEKFGAAVGATDPADEAAPAAEDRPGPVAEDRPGDRPGPAAEDRPGPVAASPPPAHAGEEDAGDRVAIVGASGRFPGARDLEAFWANLAAGVCSVTEIPPTRFDIDRHFAPYPGGPGKTYSRWGGTLDDHDRFDPLFFNISPAEAEVMDPQQRLLLEEAWRALEDAGYTDAQLSGARCGVYVGVSANNYATWGPASLRTLGNSVAILAARLAYFLDLRGPTIPIDTGCSSSLVAIHLACESLRRGEIDVAVAGGVSCNLISPLIYEYVCDNGMAARDGRCKAFDDAADGFVPGEGVGVVVLRRVADAVRGGDRIHAVLRGSGINQDGKTSGITAPSATSQTALEREVYARSGTSPHTITLVEAHGTGTGLGDPIEVAALTDAFASPQPRDQACAIGSVKTNIGHAMAAAGVAGLMKVLLALRHRQIPPSLHFHRPNRHIDFARTPFYVNTTLRPWTCSGPRRAALSSFGFSGTNAHLVLEEAPASAPRRPGAGGPRLFPISARSAWSLAQRLRELAAWVERSGDELDLADVSYTLGARRSHLPLRVAVVAATREELVARLRAAADGDAASGRRADPADALAALARAYEAGRDLEWAEVFAGQVGSVVSLPTYPFERERHWSVDPALTPAGDPLAARDVSAASGPEFAVSLPGEHWLIRDHRIGGRCLLAGAVFLELARSVGEAFTGTRVTALRDVVWIAPVQVDGATVELRLRLHRADGALVCTLFVAGEDAPRARARLEFTAVAPGPAIDLAAAARRCGDARGGDAVYPALAAGGFAYGPGFRAVASLAVGAGEAVAWLRQPAGAELPAAVLHPALLDGALQTAAGLGLAGAAGAGAYVPYGLGSLEIFGPLPATCRVRAFVEDSLRLGVEVTDEAGVVVVRLRALVARTLRAPADASTALYVPAWRPRPSSPVLAAAPIDLVLVLDDPARGALWRRRLTARRPGARVVVVGAGEASTPCDPRDRWIDPERPEAFAALLAGLPPRASLALVHVWGAASPGPEADSGSLVGLRDRLGLETGVSALFLACKALLAAEPGVARVLFVARGVDGTVEPQDHAALGLLRVLAQERRTFVGRALWFAGGQDLDAIAAAIDEELDLDGPVAVRHDGEGRAEQTLERVEAAPGRALPLRESGTYVISGGLGGLGLIFARHLAETVRARLVLLGRSPPGAAAAGHLAELERRGAEPLYLQADVADPAALRAALRRARRQFPEFHGVIHAAGVIHDRLIVDKSAAEFAEVLAPKVFGALYLDHLTREDPLDLFVLCSSAAATLGGLGQADYAAANAFLDGFAARRERLARQGLRPGRSVAIGWPWWAEGGMQVGAAAAERIAGLAGLTPMPTDAGLRALAAAVGLAAPQVLVVHGDLARFEGWRAAAPAPVAAARAGAGPGADREVPAAVEAYLRGVIARAIKLAPDRIEVDAPFERYGIDSVMVMRLSAALEEDLGVRSKTLFFEHRTIAELADHLARSHAAACQGLVRDGGAGEVRPAHAAVVAVHVEQPAAGTWAGEVRPAHAVVVPPVARGVAAVGSRADSDAAGSDDIAIVGVSGLYPQARDLDEFWLNLREGRDCVTEIPGERWSLEGFYDPDRTNPRTSYCKWGGFIADADAFDALFFQIAPREAECIDPQARKFLEVAWATLEDAGYTREGVCSRDRRDVGVFVGVMSGDYQLFGAEEFTKGNIIGPNAAYWNIANRVSSVFNFRGPSLAIDTACSSSLTALHLACESLRRGDCSAAIAGGVNLSVHPSKYLVLSQAGFAASDGRCRSFGAGGDGYVPSEGVGAVLLKPLARALADGDRIHGVIKGSAIGHGGKTSGYTVPNPLAQAEAISAAMTRGGVAPETIGYVEAHGTGTALGDPIELAGLRRAFAAAAPGRCAIGSVKSNIGHAESAAGIAGVTKVLLQLRHATLVPSLHAEPQNPNLDLAGGPFVVQRTLVPWPRQALELPRRAGVSSFGAGGSNAHVVLEEGPPARPADDRGPALVVLSAVDRERLGESAARLAAHLRRTGPEFGGLRDIAHTLQVGREAFASRLAVLAATRDELLAALESFAAGGAAGRHVAVGEAARGGAAARTDEVAAALERDDLDAVGRLWVQGAEVDWSRLAGGSRVSLPTYPFARRRCWVRLTPPAPAPSFAPHPLLDVVSPELGGPRFVKRLAASAPLLAQHRFGGQAVLPGAAALEMACAAAFRVVDGPRPTGLRGVRWAQRIAASEGACTVAVRLRRDGEAVRFEVLAGEAATARRCVTGEITGEPNTAGSTVDVAALRGRCRRTLAGDALYAALAAAGADYGPYMRGLAAVHAGSDEALAEVVLGPQAAAELEAYHLHPVVLDACFQATCAVIPEAAAGRGFLPAELGELRLGAPVGASCLVHVRVVERSPAVVRIDMDVCDANGRVLVGLRGLVVREVGAWPAERSPGREHAGEVERPGAVVPAVDEPPLAVLRPTWAPVAWPEAAATASGGVLVLGHGEDDGLGSELVQVLRAGGRVVEHVVLGPTLAGLERALVVGPTEVVFLGGWAPATAGPGDAAELAVQEDRGVMALFRVIQRLLAAGAAEPGLTLRVITGDAHRVMAETRRDPAGAAVIALGQALARERVGVRVVCVDLTGADWRASAEDPAARARLTARALAEPADPLLLPSAHRRGQRFVRRLQPLVLPEAGASLPLRERGVYFIVGGGGGIGLELGLRWARAWRARLALVGRHPPNPEQVRRIAAIEAAGGEVLYLQADTCDPAGLAAAAAAAERRFGAVHGVIHAALVLADATLASLDEATFRAAFDPKARGLVTLAQVFAAARLDFFACFSSTNAFTANPGQSGYAAGSAFADAYTLELAHRHGWRARVIDWGLWEIGRVAAERYQSALARQGVFPLRAAEGLELVERVLAGTVPQVVAIRLRRDLLPALGVDASDAAEALAPGAWPALLAGVTARAEALCAARVPQLVDRSGALAAVNQFARAGLVQALGDLLADGPPPATAEALAARLRVVPALARLFLALLDVLRRAGAVRTDAAGSTLTWPPPGGPGLAVLRDALVAEHPAAAPYADLLVACLRRLPEVLTGSVAASEVLFPGGSTALVERIYRGNAVVDHFQGLVAECVCAAARGAGAPLRILEVGAGTGGTTAFVLAALRRAGLAFSYLYTDLSAGLVQHGQRTFAGEHPEASFRVLDVERSPRSQGLTDRFDVVLAANVLHATRRIDGTLEVVKALCRPGGILLVVEATALQDFNTLTFGLTPGWWLFEDEAARLQHAPLLDAPRWRDALARAGFSGTRVFGLPQPDGPGDLQALIVAESDGVVRSAAAADPAPGASGLDDVRGPAHAPPGDRAVDAASERLDRSDPEAVVRLEAVIAAVVARSLHLAPGELDHARSFADYGADSILSVDLVRQLNGALGVELRTTTLFNHATVRDLARHVLSEFGRDRPEPTRGADAVADVAAVPRAHGRGALRPKVGLKRPDGGAEAAFLSREAGLGVKRLDDAAEVVADGAPAVAPATDAPAGPIPLAEILRLLESGALDVESALKMSHEP